MLGVRRSLLLVLGLALRSCAASSYRPDYAYTFYKLATAAYCEDVLPWTCTPCRASNQSATSITLFFNSTTDTRVYVAAYQDLFTGHMSIVVSFRGTETLENWIKDFEFAKTDRDMSCPGCKVHHGFLDSWLPVQRPVVAEIRRLQGVYPTAKLYTTGHSLGGALAVLSAYVLEYDLGLEVTGVYTYGGPRVGNAAFAAFYNNASRTHVTWRVTHARDIFVHLPYEDLGFHHVSNEVYYAKGTPADTGYYVCDGSGEDPHGANQHHTALSVHDHLYYFGERTGELAC